VVGLVEESEVKETVLRKWVYGTEV